MVKDIHYVYPRFRKLSFTLLGKEHIKQLKDKVKIIEVDEETLDNLQWLQPRDILLHPILYVTIGDDKSKFEKRAKRLERLLRVRRYLGGFETADSDRISKIAVEKINQMDLVFLPSKFAIDVFKQSGVHIPLVHLPHGINNAMYDPDKEITNNQLLKIKKLKDDHNAILILFFMLHSEYRKGADLVYEAMEFLQQRHPNFFLVLRGHITPSSTMAKLKKLKLIEITKWMPDDLLRQLYDLCDILIVPSRGGGFELNAIEGISRGLPTLVPNAGCFRDYVEHAIPLPITNNPAVFPNNPIHTGNGWETDADNLADQIERVAFNLTSWKEKAEESSVIIKQEYDWKNIGNKLWDTLQEYDFGSER